MRKSIFIAALLSFASQSFAGPHCTDKPQAEWKNKDEFKKELEKTYDIKNFKVTKGNCYEIYGTEKSSGKKVEIYFNPITGNPEVQK